MLDRRLLTREDIIDLEILRCLLSHNKGVVSRPYEGDLPLHIVTKKCNLVVVKEVFNAYPQAVYNENEDGETPLDMARSLYRENYTSVFDFLESQMELDYASGEEPLDISQLFHSMHHTSVSNFLESQIQLACQAGQEITLDENWQLPIHRALQKVLLHWVQLSSC